jgi:hypothetical protein
VSPFERLEYLYTPSADVAKDAQAFVDLLGARIGFAIEGIGARVAMVQLTEHPPYILLTDHLEGDRPIHVFRVQDLDATVAKLHKRGLKKERSLEIPMGRCVSFMTSSGHRIAIYEASRPDVLEHFLGRRDF